MHKYFLPVCTIILLSLIYGYIFADLKKNCIKNCLLVSKVNNIYSAAYGHTHLLKHLDTEMLCFLKSLPSEMCAVESVFDDHPLWEGQVVGSGVVVTHNRFQCFLIENMLATILFAFFSSEI